MTINHRYNHIVIIALILIVGLGLAFALPWLANAQGLAAQSGVPAQDNAPDSSHIHYVAITGTGTGVSWTEAFTNVQDALGAALAGDEIWVAEGVYYPDVGSGQINNAVTSTFMMADGVALYGGFDTSDAVLTDRDWENNVTVLSGDIDGDDDTDDNDVVTSTAGIKNDNAYHVVTGSGVTITAVLDGFTITAGDAHGSTPHNGGGGMYNEDSSPDVRNSILWNNQDSSGPGTISATIYNKNATITLTHSLVQGSLPGGSWIGGSYVDGGSNIDEDPLFITPISPTTAPTTTGNLRLQESSPAIDAGDNTYIAGFPTDLDGEARIKDGDGDGTATVDMGAYEAKGYYYLTVSKSGAGGGLVTSSPAGIDCGDTCSVYLQEDSTITLTAITDEDSTFNGWSDACSGTADCVVTMDAAKTVTATFTLDTHYYYLPILIK